jgi:hypothetical protein
MNFVGWHSQTLASHLSLTSQYQISGSGFVTLSVYGATSSSYYTAAMIQPVAAAQHQSPRSLETSGSRLSTLNPRKAMGRR